MLERLHLALHDRIARRPVTWLVAVSLGALLATSGLRGVRVDTSFRPLFADGGAEVAATEAIEAVFGQPSGGHVGVVLAVEHPTGPEALARIARLSTAVAGIDEVVEVVSPARLAQPVWDDDGARGAWIVHPDSAATPAGADALAAILADRPELVDDLVGDGGEHALLLARVDLPLEDLSGRRAVIAELRDTVDAHAVPGTWRLVGVSVVEAEYADIVLRSLAISFLLTTVAVVAMLAFLFRSPASVAVPMAGLSLAIPATLGLAVARGQDLTILNSVVPILVLVIGVADAIHMLESFERARATGANRTSAVRDMYADMALPCLMTTLTTAVGFLALRVAGIQAIRDFGTNVALGIVLVYLLNLVTVPALLHLVPETWLAHPRSSARDGVLPALARRIVRRPAVVASSVAILLVPILLGLTRLEVDQRFNEEVAPTHPVRADQALLEREFGGFLGPEVLVRGAGGERLTGPAARRRLTAFRDSLLELDGVHSVSTFLDVLAADGGTLDARRAALDARRAALGLDALRADPLLGPTVTELVGPDAREALVHVRTGDLGTSGARRLAEDIERVAASTLEGAHEIRISGQWWLAQVGMASLVDDLVRSLLASALVVLPLILVFLRSFRLFLVSLAPNLLPIVIALAFMGWAGITLRIGTAVVLAVALGIAVDDTLHLLVRLARGEGGRRPETAVESALRTAGPAIVVTTLVLVAGFASMQVNGLRAIRDMGTVGMVTLVAALLADLVLAPALYLIATRVPRGIARTTEVLP